MSWVGGEGTAPNTGYIGSAGIVATASQASNFAIEGSGGATSNFTPSEESELQGIARNVSITGEDILTTTTSMLYLSADDLSTFPDSTELRDIPHTIVTEGTYFIYIATRSAMDPDIKFTVSRNNAPIYEFTYRHDFSISNTDNGYAVLGHAADSFRRLNLRTGDVISAQTINTNTVARFMNTSAENITDIVEIYRRAETTSESQLIDISGGLVQSGRITSLPTGWSRRREDANGESGSLHRAFGVAFKYFSTPTWSRGVRISEIITKEQSDAITANTLKLGVTDGNVAPLAERFDRTLTLASTSLSSGTARAIIGSAQLNNPGSDYIISVLLEGASYTVDIAFGSDPIIDVSTDPGSILTLYLLGSSEFTAQTVAGSVAVDKVALAAGGYRVSIVGDSQFDFTDGVYVWLEKSSGNQINFTLDNINLRVLPNTYQNVLSVLDNEIVDRGLITNDETTDLLHSAHEDAVDYVDNEVEEWAKTGNGNLRIPADKFPLIENQSQFLNSLVQHDIHDGSFDTDVVLRGAIFDVPYVSGGRAGSSNWDVNPSFQTQGYSVIGSLAPTILDTQKSSPLAIGNITNRANLNTPATLYGRRIVDDTTGATSSRYFGFAFKVIDGQFWNGANPLTNPFGGIPFGLLKVDNREILRADPSGTYLEAFTAISDATESHQVYLSPILSTGQIATSDGNGIVIDNAGMTGVFNYNAADKASPNIITIHVGIPFEGIDVEHMSIGEIGDTLSEDRTFSFAGHNVRMRLTFDRTNDRFSYQVLGGGGGQGIVITATAQSAEHAQGSSPDFRRLLQVPLGAAPGSHTLVGFVSTGTDGILQVRFSFDGGPTQQIITGVTPVRTGDLEFGTQADTNTLNAWYYSEMIWERSTALVGDELLDEIRNLSREWASRPPIYNPFADERDVVIPAGRLKIEADDGTLADVTAGPITDAINHYVYLGASNINGTQSGVTGSSSVRPSSGSTITSYFVRFDDTLPGVNIPSEATYNSTTGQLTLPTGHWIITASLNVVTNRATNSRVAAALGIYLEDTERYSQSIYMRNDQFGTVNSVYEQFQGKVSVTGALIITGGEQITCRLGVIRQSAGTTRIDIRGAHLQAYQQLI